LEVVNAGINVIGENYWQELRRKQLALSNANCTSRIEWHFIGRLQRNKVRKVITSVAMVQSVDSLKLAEKIQRVAAQLNITVNVLLEVNIGQEPTKAGFMPDQLIEALRVISEMPNICVRGVMCMPPLTGEQEAERFFTSTRTLFNEALNTRLVDPQSFNVLSMGTSHDYRAALRCGSTMIRLGRALFE
jgi:hypothetical protein